jgi:outer membrane lipoprotein-sorting protein
MKIKSFFLLLILAITLPISAFSEDPKTPSKESAKESSADAKTDTKKAKQKELDLDQVLAKYYEAIGGLERWNKLNDLVIKGAISSQGKSMPITSYRKRPNLCRVEFRVKEVMMAQVFNGVFAWQINPLSGNPEPAPMTNSKTNFMKDSCDIVSSLISYKKKGYDVKLLGQEEIEGKKNYKIRVKYQSGNIETEYIDSETFLITRSTGIYDFDGRETRITTNYKNYKNTKGFIVPYLLVVNIHGAPGEEIRTIDKFIFNARIDPKIFEFPKDKVINIQKNKEAE